MLLDQIFSRNNIESFIIKVRARVIIAHLTPLIPPKCAKKREPEDE